MFQKIKTILIVIVIASISTYIGYLNIKIVRQDRLITLQEQELIKCNSVILKTNETLTSVKKMITTTNLLCKEKAEAKDRVKNILNNGAENEKQNNGDAKDNISENEIYLISIDKSRELIDYINTIFHRLQ